MDRSRAGTATDSPVDVREVLKSITGPRRTGSEAAGQVAGRLRERLESLGYEVRALPFSVSSWPGRFGVPLAGAVHLAGTFAAGTLLRNGAAFAALLTLVAMAVADLAIALAAPAAMRRLGAGRVEGANLLAARPDARPRWIVMAHMDTKSQPVPSAVRAFALAGVVVSWVALTGLALIALLGPVPGWVVVLAGSLGVLAGGVLLFCWAGDTSPGALDNASGVAALIGIAAGERFADDVAFVLTDGEELGLCGARALAGRLPPVAGVINMDGLDDHGPFHVMERFGRPRRGQAPHLAAALLSAASAEGLPARRRDVPFGILLDHMPLVDAGVPALTLMRGTLASLLRVHTPADDLSRLRGSGAAQAVRLVSAALNELRRREPEPEERVARDGTRR